MDKSNMIKISFTGDLMSLLPQNQASYNNINKTYDYTPIFEHVSYLFEKSDYVVGNLETPIAGKELGYTSLPTVFNTPIDFLIAIKRAGFNFVSIANNHCLDRQSKGLKNTIENIEKIGLDYGGGYKNNHDSNSLCIKEIEGVKIALFAYTYGTNSQWQHNVLSDEEKFIVDLFRKQDEPIFLPKDPLKGVKKIIKSLLPRPILERIKPSVIIECVNTESSDDMPYLKRMEERIKKAKKESDMVIMYMHSGGQYNSTVGDYTNTLVNKLQKMGCDLIVGTHPHCVLPCKYIENSFVLYSLGNFCFTPNWGYYYDGVYADYSIVLNLYIDKKNKKNRTMTFYICKVITQENGHSVVFHLKDLYRNLSNKQKKYLYNDFLSVLSRLFDKEIKMADITKEEHLFTDYLNKNPSL